MAGGWFAYHPVGGALTVLSAKPLADAAATTSTSATAASLLGASAAATGSSLLNPQAQKGSSCSSSSRGLTTGWLSAPPPAAAGPQAGQLKSNRGSLVIEEIGSSSYNSSYSSSRKLKPGVAGLSAWSSRRDTSLLKP